MRAIKNTCLMFGIAASIAMAGTCVDAKSARSLGEKVSTVTTYRSKGLQASGIHCHGTCFASGRSFNWVCPIDDPNFPPVCHLDCNKGVPGCLAQ